MANTPNVRFKGFMDDWEQRKLNEIAEKVTEKNKNNIYNEPLTNSAEMGIISQKDYFDREVVNEENLDGYYVVRDDDFVYNPRVSVTAPVGPINRNRLGRNGVMSPLYTVFRTHEINTLYLEYYFKTTKWHRFMKLNGDSGARFDRFTIATSQFMEMPIPYPDIGEQIKIGQYFDNLDQLITLHQRKCDETKELKKYMLQKMFPQNGKKIPEIRFAGFTDDWEQRKLGEFVQIISGESPAKFTEGDCNYVKVDDLNYAFKTVVSTQNRVAENSTIRKVKKGSVIFPKRGAAILTNKVRILGVDSYMDTNMMALNSDNLDTDFLYILLSREGLYKIADTSTIPQINNKHIEPYEIMLPHLKEQIKIGEYFSNLDLLITLHQRKCDELKELKKFMLQNMFPQKG